MPKRPASTLRIFLSIFLPLAVLAAGVNMFVVWNREQIQTERIVAAQNSLVALERGVLEAALDNRKADARFLADLAAIQLDSGGWGKRSMSVLSRQFLRFAVDHPAYAQVRLLDAAGREILRIDRAREGKALPIPADRLQDKGRRPYFRKALELDRAGVYVSAFDLNVEHGRVETPNRPMIRFSCPVVGEGGEKLGVVVLNLDGRGVLERMRRVAPADASELRLYNDKGFLLMGGEPDEQWAFMFPEKEALPLSATAPEVWSAMQEAPAGRILQPSGLYTFVRAGMQRIGNELHANDAAEENWIVATVVPRGSLRDSVGSVTWPITIGLLVLMAFLSWIWAGQRSERAVKEEIIKAIGQAARDPIVMVDDQDGVVFWNPAAESVFGYSAGEMMNRSLHALLLPAEKMEAVRRGFAEFARTGKGAALHEIMEFTVRTKAGNAIQVEISIAPLKLRGRWHAVGTARDVTERRKAEQTVRLLASIVESSDDAILAEDLDGNVTAWNESAERIYGYSAEEILGRHISILAPMEVKGEIPILIERIRNNEFVDHYETKSKTKDGRILDVSLNLSPVKDHEGAVIGVSAIARDISGAKKAKRALRKQQALLEAMNRAALDALVMVDGQGRVTFWNHSAERLFGYTEAEAKDREVHDLIAALPEDVEQANKGMAGFAQTGEGAALGNILEFMAKRKDGSTFPVERSMAAFQLDGRWYAVAGMRDITERKRSEEELIRLATTDPLTGLSNRRHFMDLANKELVRAKRYGTPLSILMLDLDKFKSVNDTHGHDVGDLVLKKTARIGARGLREADVFGRLGGEEFAILMPQTDRVSAVQVAERIRAAIEDAAIATPAATLKVTVSIGVAAMEDDTEDVDSMLKAADNALYAAKENGRNRVESA